MQGRSGSSLGSMGNHAMTGSVYRTQALATLPLLEPLLHDPAIERHTLLQIIDSGLPLWQCLAAQLDIRAATLRRLRGVLLMQIPVFWHSRPVCLLQLLDRLPLNLQPDCDADWLAFTDIAVLLDVTSGVSDEVHLRLSNWLLWGWSIRCSWLIQCARMGWAAAAAKLQRLTVDRRQMRQMAAFFDRQAVLLWQQGQSPQRFSQLRQQYGGYGLWRMLQLVRQQYAEPSLAIARVWPVPALRPVVLGELTAIFLSSEAELQEEGARMRNCAANYANACQQGYASIVSLRLAGRRIATACLEHRRLVEGCYFRCSQLRGVSNSEPTPAAKRALEQLLAWLNDGQSFSLRRGYCNAFPKNVTARCALKNGFAVDRCNAGSLIP